MSDEPQIDPNFLARRIERLTGDVATMRDDMTVMMAILQRLDGSLAGLVNEIRAEHARYFRLDHRLHALENHS